MSPFDLFSKKLNILCDPLTNPIQLDQVRSVRTNRDYHFRSSTTFFIVGPSSPDYQHSPSNSHCSSNHNPPSIQSNSFQGAVGYDKVSNTNNANEHSDSQRALLLTTKPNLRSFTVPVAPPIIPPPTISAKQQATVLPANAQCK